MASLGFPGIVSISFHSTTGHRHPWEIQMLDSGTGKNLCKPSSGRVIRFDCRKSISVTIEVMPGAHPHVFPHESFILHLQLNRESFNRKIGLNGLIATPDLK